MDKEQILALPPLPSYLAKDANGVEFYDGFQMHQYAMKYADAAIESYKAELLKEVGEPVGYVSESTINWLRGPDRRKCSWCCGDIGAFEVKRDAFSLTEPIFTSDQVAAAVLKATKPLDDEIERLKSALTQFLDPEGNPPSDTGEWEYVLQVLGESK